MSQFINRRELYSLLMLSLFLCGCPSVRIPPAGLDKPPKITVIGLVVGNTGTIGHSTISFTTKVSASAGTQVQVIAGATDQISKAQGGVKQLQITIFQGEQKLFDITSTSSPSVNGRVPPTLGILGTNGTGGVGPQLVGFTMNSDPVVVNALATNFNNQTSSIAVTYLANCGCNPFTQQPDEFCFCTQKTCPPPQQQGLNGCCPLGSAACNGVCLPVGEECCSDVGVPSGEHCCANPPGTTCPLGQTCCGTDICCAQGTRCANGSYCEIPLSLTGRPLAPTQRIWPPRE
jgi:hypothetical protein